MLKFLKFEFNAKSNKWCINEKTFYKGKKIDHLPFQFGLHQLINEPKNIIDKVILLH